jgi:hypothetical protein
MPESRGGTLPDRSSFLCVRLAIDHRLFSYVYRVARGLSSIRTRFGFDGSGGSHAGIRLWRIYHVHVLGIRVWQSDLPANRSCDPCDGSPTYASDCEPVAWRPDAFVLAREGGLRRYIVAGCHESLDDQTLQKELGIVIRHETHFRQDPVRTECLVWAFARECGAATRKPFLNRRVPNYNTKAGNMDPTQAA